MGTVIGAVSLTTSGLDCTRFMFGITYPRSILSVMCPYTGPSRRCNITNFPGMKKGSLAVQLGSEKGHNMNKEKQRGALSFRKVERGKEPSDCLSTRAQCCPEVVGLNFTGCRTSILSVMFPLSGHSLLIIKWLPGCSALRKTRLKRMGENKPASQ